MDTNSLIKEAKARFNHNSAKAYLKDKYSSKLSIAEQGGLWKITPELISFLSTRHEVELVLLDSYENPITVKRIDLLDKAMAVYKSVMSQWATEWKELEQKR